MATSPFSRSENPLHQGQAQAGNKGTFPVFSRSLYHQTQSKRTVETYPFDSTYLERLAASDRSTTEHFIGYFYKILVSKFRVKMRFSDEAEDVAQTTLLRVLEFVRKHGSLNSPERLGAFVNKFSENIFKEYLREKKEFQQVPENTPEPAEHALDAERGYISKERQEILRREMKKLKVSDQVLLAKIFLLDQDKDLTCVELGINRNALRVQVFRALARLRKVLENKTGADLGVARKAAVT
jgi:RNA polymerase sigma factor (sigma-70 family)